MNQNTIDTQRALGDPCLTIAVAQIYEQYGDTANIIKKAKTLLKFGKSPSIGTSALETVSQIAGDEVYVTSNIIDTISCSSAAGVSAITIEGHTVVGTGFDAKFTFVVQTVTLDGRNKVLLPTPLARVSRATSYASAQLAGDVYVYEDTVIVAGVPSDLTKAHIKILGSEGENTSFKAATTFSDTDYFILTNVVLSVGKKASASCDFQLEVRNVGGVFLPADRFAINSAGSSTVQIQFCPCIVVPRNGDIRVRAISSANNTEVSASFTGYIATTT